MLKIVVLMCMIVVFLSMVVLRLVDMFIDSVLSGRLLVCNVLNNVCSV